MPLGSEREFDSNRTKCERQLAMDTTEKSHFFSTFIFPFKYEKQNQKGDPDPNDLAKYMGQHGWKSELFKIKDHYSEWHYFHPFVREMIYQTDSSSSKMRYLIRSDFQTTIFRHPRKRALPILRLRGNFSAYLSEEYFL